MVVVVVCFEYWNYEFDEIVDVLCLYWEIEDEVVVGVCVVLVD